VEMSFLCNCRRRCNFLWQFFSIKDNASPEMGCIFQDKCTQTNKRDI